jgi:hypothetical protein
VAAAPPARAPDIEAVRGDLLRFALRQAEDDLEAAALVDLVLDQASSQLELAPLRGDLRLYLFSLMRAAFHSVERRRQFNPLRRGAARPWNAGRAAAYALPARIL